MIKEWFDSLEPRERLMVLAGGIAGIVIIFWGGLWHPLATGALELTDAVDSKRSLLASLQRARAVAVQPGMQVSGAAGQSLVLLVDQTHRGFGLEGTLTRNQPDGTDGIRVTFQDASFDALIAWLGALQANYGTSVDAATIDGGRAPGVVNATVVLRR